MADTAQQSNDFDIKAIISAAPQLALAGQLMQAMTLLSTALEAQVMSLRSDIADLKSRVDAMQKSIKDLPAAQDEKMAEPAYTPKPPIGYNPHRPGDPCPIGEKTWCAVAFRDGRTSKDYEHEDRIGPAVDWHWGNSNSADDIVGYMIVPSPTQPEPEFPKLPDGYIPHRPGDPCPIDGDAICHVLFRDGIVSERAYPANEWTWEDSGLEFDVFGYKIVPSPEQPKEERKPEWPWTPKNEEKYFYATHFNSESADKLDTAGYAFWDDWLHAKGHMSRGNVYRTEQEARDRNELDKRLAMTARLRQLGGGDEGDYVVRWDVNDEAWVCWNAFSISPGEARFKDNKSAEAAIETLRNANLLPESWQ